jgi:hypothetical protein
MLDSLSEAAEKSVSISLSIREIGCHLLQQVQLVLASFQYLGL